MDELYKDNSLPEILIDDLVQANEWEKVKEDGGVDTPEDGATKNKILAQNDAPAGDLKEGDLWFDTDANNTVYRWNGTAWVSVKDGSIAGKVTTFAQDAVPTSLAVGDLWVDTNDSNKLYRAASAGADQIAAGEWVAVNDPSANWSAVVDDDSNKPADNATVGAQSNSNLLDEASNVLDDADIKNNKIYDADEAISIRDCLAPFQSYKGGSYAGLTNISVLTVVTDGSPTSNYGSQEFADCGREGAGYYHRILFKLDRALVGRKFQFKIYLSAETGAFAFHVKVVTSTWAEGTVTWNTKPSVGLDLHSETLSGTGWHTITVENVPYSVIADIDAYGICLMADEATIATGNVWRMDTEDGTNVPQSNVETGGTLGTRWVKADATDDNYKLNAIAFAKAAAAEDADCKGQFSGIVSGLSGLLPGELYYLSDTAGAISSSAGTNSRVVGIAISTTELLINHPSA